MKAEVLEKFESLLKEDWNKEILSEIKVLVEALNEDARTEEENQLKSFLEDPENEAGDFSPTPSEERKKYLELYVQYKEKRKKYAENKAKEERNNLERKLNLIEEISKVTQEEENIGKAFHIFKSLKEEFEGIGRVPGDKHKDVLSAFHTAIDQFYYNIKIYQDLKELDLKKNYDLKKEVVEKVKALEKITISKEVEKTLRNLQNEWYATGPVPKDEYDALKEEFQKASDVVYERVREFQKERKEQMQENLDKKRSLLDNFKSLDLNKLDSHKAWKKETDNLVKLQEEWKAIGFGPKKENEEVWAEFREACDRFFEVKGVFYDGLKGEQDENKTKKEKLISEAEALKDSADWIETSKKLIHLQNQWKRIGGARQRDEQKLWKRFRDACNTFFDTKTKFFEDRENNEKENLEKKKAWLEKNKEVNLEGSNEAKTKAIKVLAEEWNAIGFVPKKEAKDINKAYDEIITSLYKQAGVKQEDISRNKFEAKIQSLLADDNAEDLVKKEVKFLRDKIKKHKDELLKLENNLGFFGRNINNPLAQQVLKNVEKEKAVIEAIENQIRTAKMMLTASKKEKEASAEIVEEKTEG